MSNDNYMAEEYKNRAQTNATLSSVLAVVLAATWVVPGLVDKTPSQAFVKGWRPLFAAMTIPCAIGIGVGAKNTIYYWHKYEEEQKKIQERNGKTYEGR